MDATQTTSNFSSRAIGPSIRILQVNVEGISQSKSEYLEKLAKLHKADLIAAQETHTADEISLTRRGNVNGFTVAGATYHRNYGTVTYVRDSIDNWLNISANSNEEGVSCIVTRVSDITVTNIYKPPNATWEDGALPKIAHPSVSVGDFNSHHTQWGYRQSDQNGETILQWMEQQDLFLCFDAKERGTFRSARWNTETNPDLCLVTKNDRGMPLHVTRKVLSDFPHSQHRPVLITIGINIPLIESVPKPRWNFRKADWNVFSASLDANVRWVKPEVNNYSRFTRLVKNTAKKCVPRGFRKEFIPCWTEESTRLYNEFEESGDTEIADDLLQSLDNARRQRWMDSVEDMDFKHSSRKAWSLLRRVGASNSGSKSKPKIRPNTIANRIMKVSRTKIDNKTKRNVKRNLRLLRKLASVRSHFSRPPSVEEIDTAISNVKNGKAAGLDEMFPEFLTNCGKNTKSWISRFYGDIIRTQRIPLELKRTKIVAILKPGKTNDIAANFRPISMLSVMYKLLERVLYNRIKSVIDAKLPDDQAGFRENRSCADQVLALSTHIELGFEKCEKTAVVLIDLTSAYDTVWKHGLLYKLVRAIPCNAFINLINDMLSKREFVVYINNENSKKCILENGLPQGSVLAPLLFNLYISDMPSTSSRKFCYADDSAIAAQSNSFRKCEETLNKDLLVLEKYFKKWGLKPNPRKTESITFHLNNHQANYQLALSFCGQSVKHNSHPKYLGHTLDRSLTHREHCEKTAAKIKSRNNIIHKLCGTTWGADAETLRTTALALVFSTAEYCSPIWLNSAHTGKIDVQLNETLRTITGAVKSTPTEWLPVLSNIAPPHLRRQQALLNEYQKIQRNPNLPIHFDMELLQLNRLVSRKPSLKTAKLLVETEFDINGRWHEEWLNSNVDRNEFISNPSERVPGFCMPRKEWVTLNRFRTGHGRCAYHKHMWGLTDDPSCDCGAPNQTMKHIATECPLRAFSSDFMEVHEVTAGVQDWLKSLDLQL